jgi:hypothetical protein
MAALIFLMSQMTARSGDSCYILHGFSVLSGCRMSYPVLIAYSQKYSPERTPGFAAAPWQPDKAWGRDLGAFGHKIYTSTETSLFFLLSGTYFHGGDALLSLFLYSPPKASGERMIAEAGNVVKVGTAKARALVYDVDKPQLILTRCST